MASSPNQSSEAVSAHKPLLAVLNGEKLSPPPVWMMRQAGRYLPEYRQLRADKGSFLDLVYDSDAAADVTLQPLHRFPDLDAAILFSDILIVPFAIGQNLSFVAGEGPRLTPPLVSAALEELKPFPARLEPIYETVRKVKAQLDPSKTLIGFAGAPWTVATYMVAGQGVATSPRRGVSLTRTPRPFRRSSIVSRRSRSITSRARSRPARKSCNCSTAGQGAWPHRSSSAG